MYHPPLNGASNAMDVDQTHYSSTHASAHHQQQPETALNDQQHYTSSDAEADADGDEEDLSDSRPNDYGHATNGNGSSSHSTQSLSAAPTPATATAAPTGGIPINFAADPALYGLRRSVSLFLLVLAQATDPRCVAQERSRETPSVRGLGTRVLRRDI